MVALSSWLVGVVATMVMADPPPIQRPDNLMAPPIVQAAVAPEPTPPTEPPPEPTPPTEPAPVPEPAAPEPAPNETPATPPTAQPTPSITTPRVPATAEPPPSGKPSAGALRREAEDDEPYPHRGVVGDVLVGPMGCVRAMCGGDRHDVSAGVRVSGFVGGNIRGWVELGLAGGFGAMRSRATEGTNALSLYGLDPWLLQAALAAQSAGLINMNLGGLAITRARMQSAQVGPQLRVHFIPRGRVMAWAGAGLSYNLLRNKYDTVLGDAKMDFHGLAVPIEAALGVAVHEHIALTAQFQYLWTWYGLAVFDHPDQSLALPMSALQQAAQLQGVDIRGELPQFWTVGLGLRGRF